MRRAYYVYCLVSKSGVLYTGITNNLKRRVWEHKREHEDSFTGKYRVNKLVYFEEYTDPTEAIVSEKQLKNWHREWKLNLIANKNPNFEEIIF